MLLGSVMSKASCLVNEYNTKKIMFLFVAKLEQNFEKHETSAIDILPRKAQFQSSGLHICAALPASALILKH